MCGIAGQIETGNRQSLGMMAQVLSHRGPDYEGIVWFDQQRTGLAHRRLSIIDLSASANQPMRDDKGNLFIVFNGEIYNFGSLKGTLSKLGYSFKTSSDTEVILAAYQEWGPECLSRLNGMFAFAIYDKEANKLFAARDHIGVKPFYYWIGNGALVFASEIKAILASGLVEKRPDYIALHTPTRFQISPYTGFQGIYKLPPGHYITFKDHKLQIKQYWDIATTESDNGANENELVQKLDQLLRDSVRLQMIADVPVGILLSGGLDSSIIGALMRGNTNQDIHSFTIKYSGRDKKFERMPDDSQYAETVAQKFEFIHHEIELDPSVKELLPLLTYHLDEPLADPAAINTYLISKAAREEGIIVLLNGMGGDEIFGGYRKQLACMIADLYNSHVPRTQRNLLESLANKLPVATSTRGIRAIRWGKRFLSFCSLPRDKRYLMADLSLSPTQYAQMFTDGIDYHSTYFYRSQMERLKDDSLSYLTRMCLNDTKVLLPEHNLTYSDKASMAASVEGRPPLTDHRIADFMFSLRPEFRIRRLTQKYLLKKAAEPHLPKNIIYRPKAPFGAPLRSWIRGPLSEMVDDLLSEESLKKQNLYNPRYVRQLVIDDRAGKEDNSLIIWTLLTNQIWFATFFN